MGFSVSFLKLLRSRIRLSAVVGKHVELRRHGKDWRGLSPFGLEKAPSFRVDDEKGLFVDPLSGKHGDIFDFIVEIDGLAYDDAVEKLAAEAGFSQAEILRQKSFLSLNSSTEIRTWLRLQSQTTSLTYATRTALRALPFLAALSDSKSKDGKDIESICLLTFRAVAAAWTSARYPSRQKGLRKTANESYGALIAVRHDWDFKSPSNFSVGRACAAAARAVQASSSSASTVALNIEESFTGIGGESHFFADLELHGASSDVGLLNEGFNARKLIREPLWLGGMPIQIRNEWEELSSGLTALNKDWLVWVDWYNARLEGRPAKETTELTRAKIPQQIWDGSPAIVLSRIVEAVSGSDSNPAPLKPLDNLPSPFAFNITDAGKISLAASPSNTPLFPFRSSQRDHLNRLSVCRTLAQDILSDLTAGKFQVRQEYTESLRKYASRLPDNVGDGNFLLAEAEARTLRSLFAAEVGILSVALAAQLKTFLEQHMGLRVFYPDVENFYRDVQSGRLIEPLPLDAIDGFLEGIKENTPMVFDATVKDAIEGSLQVDKFNAPNDDREKAVADTNQPLPPHDPLGEIDPQSASDFTFAGAANGLWKVFLQGEKIHKAMDGWAKTREVLAPHVNEIISWLHKLLASGRPPDIGV